MKNFIVIALGLIFSTQMIAQSNIQLNNGERWQVNPEITSSVKSMQKKIAAFEKGEFNDKATFHYALMEDFQNLFTYNTMEGGARQQMANFAMPIRLQLVYLDQCTQAPCKAEVSAIKESLSEYDLYFE